jgi:hypothetical protein
MNTALVESLELWNQLLDRSAIPPLLYHYTSFNGLLGIISEHQLRATLSEALNDGSEWEYGRELVARYAASITDEVRNAVAPPSTFLQAPPTAIFVACFCEEPNLLSMWRSYTAMGGGFSLGFDGHSLGELRRDNLANKSYMPRLVKMHYGETLPDVLTKLLESGGHVNAEWVVENMIKNPSFKEEKEWRILVPDPPVSIMSFYSGQSNVRAFVNVRSARKAHLPLRKIVYGPTLRDDSTLVKTLRWMLQKYGYENVEVEASGIPYRL